MYTPQHFKFEDRELLQGFMRRNSFATLVTQDSDAPFATHLPVLLDLQNSPKGVLRSHVAKANPQWKHLQNSREVLVIFTGPHAYISPTYYKTSPAVPTWNYSAVHVYGVPKLITDSSVLTKIVEDLVEFYEIPRGDRRWDGKLPPEFRDGLIKAIVGFEIEITRIEGKLKLSQNRPEEDISSVIQALEISTDQTERDLAVLMKSIRPV